MKNNRFRTLTIGLIAFLLTSIVPLTAQAKFDNVPRTVIMSAFGPELDLLKSGLTNEKKYSVAGIEFSTGRLNGQNVVLFLSGISVTNAAMSTQAVIDHFNVERLLFSGIAGGVDPDLHIGDVIIAERWGQYLERLFARDECPGSTADYCPIPEVAGGSFRLMYLKLLMENLAAIT